jgi:hypothetical protein
MGCADVEGDGKQRLPLILAAKACHARASKARRGPSGSLESRTATVRSAVATSMQLPPFPEL